VEYWREALKHPRVAELTAEHRAQGKWVTYVPFEGPWVLFSAGSEDSFSFPAPEKEFAQRREPFWQRWFQRRSVES
jgi:hypothetical protein